MANRGRFLSSRGRNSYKPSEVVGLFVVSVIVGGVIGVACYLVDLAIGKMLGR